jgi:ArsR family transcriptional regulator
MHAHAKFLDRASVEEALATPMSKSSDAFPRDVLACLGDRSRFELVRRIATRAECVSELASQVGLSQSCTTRHLQVLVRRGVVQGQRRGKKVVFQLRDDRPEISALVEWALASGEASTQTSVANGRRSKSRAERPTPKAGPGPAAASPEPAASDSSPLETAVDSEPAPQRVSLSRHDDLEDFLL